MDDQSRPVDPRGSESTRELRDTSRRRRDAEEKLQQHLMEAKDHVPNEFHEHPGHGYQGHGQSAQEHHSGEQSRHDQPRQDQAGQDQAGQESARAGEGGAGEKVAEDT